MNDKNVGWKINIRWQQTPSLFYSRGYSAAHGPWTPPKVPWWTWLLRRCLRLVVILRYLVTSYCGHVGCGHVEPYGFVPEAGCPVHDSDSRFFRWIRKIKKEYPDVGKI